MASKVSGVIEYIQPGGSSGTKYAIAATAYGVCDTAASEAIKNVEMTGFKLQEGMTVHIKFTNANSVSNPKLKFNSEANTNAKPIVQYGTTAAGITEETDGWYAGAVLTLTYDGTSWVRDQGFNTNIDTKVTQTISSTDKADYRILLSGTADDTTRAEGARKDTNFKYNPNTNTLTIGTGTLTATNYSGKAATAGTATNATNATTATYIKCTDTRDAELEPVDMNATQGVRFDFKAKHTINLTATDGYAGVITFRPYAAGSDWTGGPAHQLAFNTQGIYWRTGSSAWNTWERLATANEVMESKIEIIRLA